MNLKLKYYKQTGELTKVGLYYHIPVSVEESYRDEKFANLSCPICKSGPNQIIRHSKYKYAALDISFRDTPSKLIIERIRYKCNICGSTFVEALPGINEHFKITDRAFEVVKEYIEQKQKTYTAVSQEIGMSMQAVRNIAHFLTETSTNTSSNFKTPSALGIHEFKLLSTYVTIITNIESKKIINIIPRRNIKLLQEYINNLQDKDQIKYIFADVSPFSINSIKNIIQEVGLAKTKLLIDRNKIATTLSSKFLAAILEILSPVLTQKDKIDSRYISAKMLSYAEQGNIEKAEDIIHDMVIKYQKQSQILQTLYEKYKILIRLIYIPSKNDIKNLRISFIKNNNLNQIERELSQIIINFEQEIFTSKKQIISLEYRNHITQLFKNLKKLKSTYAIGELWDHLLSLKYYSLDASNEKMLRSYTKLYSKKEMEQNEGFNIKILNEILTNLS